jgi:lipoate-protein ligase A
VQLVVDAFPVDPSFDLAVSHALLRRVAERRVPATARIYRPGATVAFGRLDALRETFGAAVRAAGAHDFTPVLRSVGGHAAAYTDQAVIYEEITPHEGLAVDVEQRFGAFSARVAGALRELGADARVGEIPGEYCPGRFTVNAGGAIKLAGVAQRLVRGAALVSAAIVVGDPDRVRAVLEDVYAQLGLAWDPATAGALDDVVPGATPAAVQDALEGGHASLEPAPLDAPTLALARTLQERHRLTARAADR